MPFDNQQITEISLEQLDSFFAEDVVTPTAETLVVGKEETTPQIINANPEEIPVLKEDDFATEDDPKPPIEDDPKPPVEDDEKLTPEVTAVKEVLKNTVDYLVKEGFWQDFEGRENLEVTEETYAELATKQAQHAAYEIVNELIDNTGSYGKAIISHIKSGGNPDEIIDIFKEEKEIKSIDVSTEEGKQLKIEKYYKDVLNWKAEKVDRTIKRLVENNEIETEFTDVEELYNKYYSEKLKETQSKAAEQEQVRQKKQIEFTTSIKDVLKTSDELTVQEKKLIETSILDFKHKLEDGKRVNDFYLKFAEMQADPKQYVKLVRFVMDNENYEKQIKAKEESAANKKVFQFIKNGAALNVKNNTNVEIKETKKPMQKQGTDFALALNNK